MNTAVKDVMSTRVIAVRLDTPYKRIAALLREQRVSAFPVVDKGNRVLGVVSEDDLLTKEAFAGRAPLVLRSMPRQRENVRANAVTAADLMTKPAVTIDAYAPVTHAARLMYNRRVKRLPVTTGDGTLIGIVSRSDVLSVYSRPDADIHHEITQDVILNSFLCNPVNFIVTVKDGVVTIQGSPETILIGREIIDAARHVEGVVAVRDRLSRPVAAPYRTTALS